MPARDPPEQFLLRSVIHCLISTSEKAITKAAARVNHSLAADLLLVATNAWEYQLKTACFFSESSY